MPLPPPPETVLIYVGIDAVGDGLIKLPFVRALRAAFPAARLTWLAGKGPSAYAGALAPLVAGLLDEVIDHRGPGSGIGSHPAELLHRPLAGRSFDLIIDTQRRLLTTLILRRIRHRRFISATGGFVPSDARPPSRAKPVAMAAQLMTLADLAAGRPIGPLAPLPRDPVAERTALDLLPPGARYVGMAPGAGGRHKCWPLDRFIRVGAALAADGLVPVVLLGPAEADWAEQIRDRLPTALLPLQAVESVTPMLTIALARRLSAAVANDSGTGHMLAAADDIGLVSLFGPTPAEKFAPACARLRVVRAQSFGGQAMESIPEAAVLAALRALLA